MPNWCEHDLIVSGHDLGSLAQWQGAVIGSGDGDVDRCSILRAFLPVPDELTDTVSPSRPPYQDRKIATCAEPADRAEMERANAAFAEASASMIERFGFDNWYDWSIANWGTKWPDSIYRMERRPRSIQVTGCCAWAPPLPGLESISGLFPTLRFTLHYFEAGNGFSGRAVLQAGSILVHDQRAYRGRRGG